MKKLTVPLFLFVLFFGESSAQARQKPIKTLRLL